MDIEGKNTTNMEKQKGQNGMLALLEMVNEICVSNFCLVSLCMCVLHECKTKASKQKKVNIKEFY